MRTSVNKGSLDRRLDQLQEGASFQYQDEIDEIFNP